MKNLKSKKIFIILVASLVILSGVTFAGIKIAQKMNKITTCMVQFESSGGTKINFQEIEKGMQIIEPVPPTKEGFSFIEWQLNGEKFDFNSPITEDVILIAKWEANAETIICTVTFDSDGGNKIEPIEVAQGNTITAPSNPQKEGFSFKAWLLDNEEFDFNSTINENICLKASWTKQIQNTQNTQKTKTNDKQTVIQNAEQRSETNLEEATPENAVPVIQEPVNTEPVENENIVKEKVYPTGIILSQSNVNLHYDESITISYTLTYNGLTQSELSNVEIINNEMVIGGGIEKSKNFNAGKHKFYLNSNGTISVNCTSANVSSYTSACEIPIYAQNNPSTYLGVIKYNFLDYPIKYINSSAESVTLKAPTLTAEGKIPLDSDRIKVTFDYGFPNKTHESWEVTSSNNNVAIVRYSNPWVNEFTILPYTTGTAIVTIRVCNNCNSLEKQIYVTVIDE